MFLIVSQKGYAEIVKIILDIQALTKKGQTTKSNNLNQVYMDIGIIYR